MRLMVAATLIAVSLTGGVVPALAQALTKVQPGDPKLDCAAISAETRQMDEWIAAGDPNAPGVGKAAAGAAANAGGQVAGAVAAQGSGLFGGLGGLVSKMAGAVAQQQVEAKMAPDAAAQQRAAEARECRGFLSALALAKECRSDDPARAGKALSDEEFRKLAQGPAAGEFKPFSANEVEAALKEPVVPLDGAGLFEGAMKIGGKRIYVSEFRVLFEVSGEASASTRAGYMPGGTNYGATRSRTKYQVANIDVSALQALTDWAWADLKERLAARGVKVEDTLAFVAQYGAVYQATEPASTAAAPVYVEQNLGHVQRKYLVMAPAGMKLHARGLAGLGAGDIGKRIEFSKSGMDGIAIGVAVNIAALETSGSGSSILHRDGSSTAAGEAMSITAPPGAFVASGHVDAGALRMPKAIKPQGNFARFREVGGYDTQKDGVVRALQIAGNLAGVAANKSKTVELQVDLDGPTASRMASQGLATFNAALSDQFKQ